MNSDFFDDLKQFITAALSQTEARLLERLEFDIASVRREVNDLRKELSNFREETREGFLGVGEAMDETAIEVDARFIALEQQAA